MLGTDTSTQAQITSIESAGFWLLVADREYYVPFERYPEFREATLAQVFNFQQIFDQFHWPDLDIDIELESLDKPERFSLIFKR